MREIIGGAFGGIVGEEGVADVEPAKGFEEGFCSGEECSSLVNGAVHVENDMLDAGEGGGGRHEEWSGGCATSLS
jgi:hypothetical protein